MRWYVVYTQSHAEVRALRHLERQGFNCFLPRVRVLRRHARKIESVLAPLFPRYLFVQFELDLTRWRAINGTHGVVRLLASGPRPIPVAPGMVETLITQCDAQGAASLPAIAMFMPGVKVRLKGGAFAGQTAEVSEPFMRGKDRVQVLLHFLGVQAKLQVPPYALEAA